MAGVAAAAAVTAAVPKTPPGNNRTTPNSKSAPSEGAGDNDTWRERVKEMEKTLRDMREEKEKMKLEINELRDKLEEEVWAKNRLEGKVTELSDRLKEIEDKAAEGGGGGGETEANRNVIREERKKEIEEAEKRMEARIKQLEDQGGGGGGGGRPTQTAGAAAVAAATPKQRCVIFTDSNGREATHDSIMNHVPRERRGEFDVEVAVAYTLEEAHRRTDRGEFRLEGAIVVVDNLTNDVRGTRGRPPVSPQQLVRLVDGLRRKVMAAGAVAVVVCQLKPMQTTDVTPYNDILDSYLRREKERGRDGFGCRTMIRLDSLKGDGYHLRPEFWSVLDRTYACAMLGIDVPFPTPWNDFAPSHVRQRWEMEWPRLGGGAHMDRHGR